MKTKFYLTIALLSFLGPSWKNTGNTWISEKQNKYTLLFTPAEKSNLKEYKTLIKNGIKNVETYFRSSYSKEFNVVIHPNRRSLDSTWKKDWEMPDFKSECWMVASGIASKLDMISPKVWDKQSCEHIYSENEKTQQLITHELVHVYHGQMNISPDFSNVDGIDWFVEGLATFVSGQCDTSRISEIKNAISKDKVPTSLDNFWTGKLKYGLSGSMVKFIAHKYGETKLTELLPLNKKTELLSVLKTTENELVDDWKEYILKL